MGRRTGGVARRRAHWNQRGETLVETIVAFSVLLILLALVTQIVQGAISLNLHAQQTSAALDGACSKAETDAGVEVGGPSDLTVSFPGTTCPEVKLRIQRKNADALQYFTGE